MSDDEKYFLEEHWLLYGQTGAGKSAFLEFEIIPIEEKNNRDIIAFDPFESLQPSKHVFVTSNRKKFYDEVWKREYCRVIFDEAGNEGKYDKNLDQLAMLGRHNHHDIIFASQRVQLLSTTVRGQCKRVIAFHLTPKDAKFLADEFGNDELLKTDKLQTLQYIMADRWGKIKKGMVTISNN